MPSGNAGLTTRINTTITPISAPKIHLPVLVMDADTGSVAIKIMPKAKPPTTKCQYHGIANNGFVSDPSTLNSELRAIIPIITPATMRHAAIRIISSTAPPIKIASVLVSPTEPCTLPIKASIQVIPEPTICSMPPAAPKLKLVAPAKPSTEVHTASPESCAG